MFDVAELAQAGAAALVGAMASDGWTVIRTRLGGLFGRTAEQQLSGRTAEQQLSGGDNDHSESVLHRVDDVRTAITRGADPDEIRPLQAELQKALETRLRDDPDLAARLSALVSEVREHVTGSAQTTRIEQRARVDRGGSVIQAGRDVIQYDQPAGA